MNLAPLTALLLVLSGWMSGVAVPWPSEMPGQAVVIEDRVKLREEVWGAKLDSLAAGDVVEVQSSTIDEDGAVWYRVEAEGQQGWIYGEYIRPAASARSDRRADSGAPPVEPTPEASVAIAGSATDETNTSISEGAASAGRVGLQVGHWRNEEAAYPFSAQDGAAAPGFDEAETNLGIAEQAAGYLRERGFEVDILPTKMPSDYRADVVVAIHADGGPSSRRGFFADGPANSSAGGSSISRLVRLLNEEYKAVTSLSHVYRGTENTLYYYGYYSVADGVPMALIETGFLTNAEDREVIVKRPDLAGRGIGRAIERFLTER